MPRRTWVEAALNGGWTRRVQPGIPVLAAEIIEEGVACARAGAAVIHAHTLRPGTGEQDGSVENCVAFIAGIRERVDAIVYPTVVGAPDPADPAWLFAPTIELARRGLLEWGFIDPGSMNFRALEPDGVPLIGGDGMYVNTNAALDRAAALMAGLGLHPTYACYEPGFVRQGALLHDRNQALPVPIYRLMFTSGMTYGFPPEPWAVEAYARLLSMAAPGAPWMVAGHAVDVLPLIPTAVALGGGVRVGLEDAVHGTLLSNVELVEAAVNAIQKAGSEPATAADVRADLARYRRP